MSSPWTGEPKELEKWRVEAARSAAHLKSGNVALKDTMKVGFVFNEGKVAIFYVTKTEVTTLTGPQLARHIYEGVLKQFKEGGTP